MSAHVCVQNPMSSEGRIASIPPGPKVGNSERGVAGGIGWFDQTAEVPGEQDGDVVNTDPTPPVIPPQKVRLNPPGTHPSPTFETKVRLEA